MSKIFDRPKLKFSQSTLSKVRSIKLNRDIITADIKTPQAVKEIKRVFQMANRRIQNIQNGGYLSPAVQALGIDVNDTTFTKFSTKGKDWNEIKIQYARVIGFLQNPTSTAQGSRQWQKSVQNSLGFSDKLMKKVVKVIKENQNDFVLKSPVENVKEEFETAASDISDFLERESKNEKNLQQLENELNEDITDVQSSITNDVINSILDSFKNFRL